MSTLVKTLASKPWLRAKDPFAEPVDVRAFPLAEKKIGLLAFFFVASSLFMLFIVGYRLRMVYPDWAPLREPVTLWINTGILVLASLALELARQALRKGNNRRAGRAFIAGGVGSLLFVAGQLAAWQELSQAGFLVASNPASSFFYLLTGIHGIHIAGGLVASFAVGWLALTLLLRIVRRGRLHLFALYLVPVGLLGLILLPPA